MAHHAGLSLDRWRAFSLDQRVLMIANEMHRAGKLTGRADAERRQSAYARVLQLTDLTIEVGGRPALRRELLRWRDLAAALYLAEAPSAAAHRAALRALLLLTPAAARQVPILLPDPRAL